MTNQQIITFDVNESLDGLYKNAQAKSDEEGTVEEGT